jgi:hypothetical protein
MMNDNANSDDMKLHSLINGDLNDTEQQTMFEKLHSDAALQHHYRDLVRLRAAMEEDAHSLCVPPEATAAVFAAIGLSAPTANAPSVNASTASAPTGSAHLAAGPAHHISADVMSVGLRWLSRRWLSVLTLGVSIIGATVFVSIRTQAPEPHQAAGGHMRDVSPSAAPQTTAPVSPSTPAPSGNNASPSTTAQSFDGTPMLPNTRVKAHTGNTEHAAPASAKAPAGHGTSTAHESMPMSRNVATGSEGTLPLTKPSGNQDRQPLALVDSVRHSPRPVSGAETLRPEAHPSIAQPTHRTDPIPDQASATSAPPPDTSAARWVQSVFHSSSPLGFIFGLRGILAASLPAVDVASQTNTSMRNIAISIGRAISPSDRIGIEAGREAFSQKFGQANSFYYTEYEQSPLEYWMTAFYNRTISNVFTEDLTAYAQLNAGMAWEIGPMLRCSLGVRYPMSEMLGVYVAGEGTVATYKFNSHWLTSKKYGVTGGISLSF